MTYTLIQPVNLYLTLAGASIGGVMIITVFVWGATQLLYRITQAAEVDK